MTTQTQSKNGKKERKSSSAEPVSLSEALEEARKKPSEKEPLNEIASTASPTTFRDDESDTVEAASTDRTRNSDPAEKHPSTRERESAPSPAVKPERERNPGLETETGIESMTDRSHTGAERMPTPLPGPQPIPRPAPKPTKATEPAKTQES